LSSIYLFRSKKSRTTLQQDPQKETYFIDSVQIIDEEPLIQPEENETNKQQEFQEGTQDHESIRNQN
jgi:hypothetical protein